LLAEKFKKFKYFIVFIDFKLSRLILNIFVFCWHYRNILMFNIHEYGNTYLEIFHFLQVALHDNYVVHLITIEMYILVQTYEYIINL